jgi:hypothetical protein
VLKLKHTPHPALIWLGVAAASLAAFAAVILHAPMGWRLVAAAILLLVPGVGLARLLLPRNEVRGIDGALVIPLSVLLGVLSWLGVAMALNAFGVRLSPMTIALTLTVAGLVFTGLAIRPGIPRPVAATRTVALRRYRTAAAAVTAAVLLSGATAGAVALIPTPKAPYTTVAFVDNTPFGDRAPLAAPGSMVRLQWIVRGFGRSLSPALTSVRLAIDGVPVSDVAVDINPDTAPDITEASAALSGAVTFSAPVAPGKHTVDLFVQPTAQDGSDVPTPGYVSTSLQVTA